MSTVILLVTGCAGLFGGTPDLCPSLQQILISNQELSDLTDETLEQILEYNLIYEQNCLN